MAADGISQRINLSDFIESTTMRNKSKAQATGLLYAQSGGVTAAINSSAKGALEAAVAAGRGRVLTGSNGILGVLEEELVDVSACGSRQLAQLRNLPGGAFGSCRYKLPDPRQDPRPYQRIADVFRAHQIGSFLYNGGNDSQDTTSKISAFCKSAGVPVACVGIPKTIDNDLVRTDCCPGFGSAAKYIATSVAECALDVASMARTSTKLFVIEVMGRDAGWLTAAAGLAGEADSPIMLLLPEVPFAATKFVRAIRQRVSQHGYCIVACSEGVRNARGELLASRGGADAFAHVQLGGGRFSGCATGQGEAGAQVSPGDCRLHAAGSPASGFPHRSGSGRGAGQGGRPMGAGRPRRRHGVGAPACRLAVSLEGRGGAARLGRQSGAPGAQDLHQRRRFFDYRRRPPLYAAVDLRRGLAAVSCRSAGAPAAAPAAGCPAAGRLEAQLGAALPAGSAIICPLP